MEGTLGADDILGQHTVLLIHPHGVPGTAGVRDEQPAEGGAGLAVGGPQAAEGHGLGPHIGVPAEQLGLHPAPGMEQAPGAAQQLGLRADLDAIGHGAEPFGPEVRVAGQASDALAAQELGAPLQQGPAPQGPGGLGQAAA